jgi:hypothetical protein
MRIRIDFECVLRIRIRIRTEIGVRIRIRKPEAIRKPFAYAYDPRGTQGNVQKSAQFQTSKRALPLKFKKMSFDNEPNEETIAQGMVAEKNSVKTM